MHRVLQAANFARRDHFFGCESVGEHEMCQRGCVGEENRRTNILEGHTRLFACGPKEVAVCEVSSSVQSLHMRLCVNSKSAMLRPTHGWYVVALMHCLVWAVDLCMRALEI